MSNSNNTLLMDRAAEMMAVWESTLVEDGIRKALDDGDLERLRYLVLQAEAEESRQEFNKYDIC